MDERIINNVELRVFGMRRSGIHAIVNWVGRQAKGPSLFLNNISRLRRNPFARCNRPATFNGDAESFNLAAEMEGKLARKSYLILGYEDKDTSRIPRGFHRQLQKYVGHSRVYIYVIVLRDPFNLFASRMASKPTSSMNGMLQEYDKRIELWKSHARECVGLTKEINGTLVPVLFNRWFVDQEYRRQIAENLLLNFTDAGIEEVPGFGGGSSFDRRNMNGQAQRMDVLSRWQKYVNAPAYLRLFEDEELLDLSRQLFGEMDADRHIQNILTGSNGV